MDEQDLCASIVAGEEKCNIHRQIFIKTLVGLYKQLVGYPYLKIKLCRALGSSTIDRLVFIYMGWNTV